MESLKYSYIFYYFAALKLQDSLGDESTRARIRALANSLHLQESANILLFLVHLKKDDFLMRLLLETAAHVFENASAAALLPGEYVVPDKHLLEIGTALLFEVEDPTAERRKMLADLDARQQTEIGRPHVVVDAHSALGRIANALAVLQLLGQIAKNFPGALEASAKVDLLNACYGIGRRLIGWYLGFVKDNNMAGVAEFSRELQRDKPRLPLREAVERAQEMIGELVTITCFAVVKAVSGAVGSHHLVRTYQKVMQKDVPLVALFDMSIKLDHVHDFPEADIRSAASAFDGNHLPRVVLGALVAQHFCVFPVPIAVRQSLSKALGFRHPALGAASPQKKLLAAPKRGNARPASGKPARNGAATKRRRAKRMK